MNSVGDNNYFCVDSVIKVCSVYSEEGVCETCGEDSDKSPGGSSCVC